MSRPTRLSSSSTENESLCAACGGGVGHEFHEAACVSDDPKEICRICGATQDRAIHQEWFAQKHGWRWVPLAEHMDWLQQ